MLPFRFQEEVETHPKLLNLGKDENPFFPELLIALEDCGTQRGGLLKFATLNEEGEVLLANIHDVVDVELALLGLSRLKSLLIALSLKQPSDVVVQVTRLRHHNVLGADDVEDVLTGQVLEAVVLCLEMLKAVEGQGITRNLLISNSNNSDLWAEGRLIAQEGKMERKQEYPNSKSQYLSLFPGPLLVAVILHIGQQNQVLVERGYPGNVIVGLEPRIRQGERERERGKKVETNENGWWGGEHTCK